jgi:hypothetical protein
MKNTDFQITTLSKIKKGEYFRFTGKSKVYIYDGKVRIYDKWGSFKKWGFGYVPFDDCLRDYKQTGTDRKIEINF